MSKLSEYSKFDHLDDDDDDDSDDDGSPSQPVQYQQPLSTLPPPSRDAAAKSTKTEANSLQQQPGPSVPTIHAASPSSSGASPRENLSASASGGARMIKDEKTGRFVFMYNDRVIYSWEQSLDSVTIYVTAPPTITKANQINCIIQPNRLKLGIKDHTSWYLNEDTFGTVDVSESVWSLEDDDDDTGTPVKVITIYLTKSNRGTLWQAALKGNPNATTANPASPNNPTAATNGAAVPTAMLDPMSQEQVKKQLMLERFQEEHPGYDFRDAEFNGSIPDARTFMGGVKYD